MTNTLAVRTSQARDPRSRTVRTDADRRDTARRARHPPACAAMTWIRHQPCITREYRIALGLSTAGVPCGNPAVNVLHPAPAPGWPASAPAPDTSNVPRVTDSVADLPCDQPTSREWLPAPFDRLHRARVAPVAACA